MGEIINFQNYRFKKTQQQKSEEKLAHQILERFHYENQNIAIPIVKVAKKHKLMVYRENFCGKEKLSMAGKLFIGETAKKLYDCNQVIVVNSNDHLFQQRIAVARLLGQYLLDIANKKLNSSLNFSLSESLLYKELYDRYKEFVLHILAPDQVFVRQYNLAIENKFTSSLVNKYLSEFFEVPQEFVKRKVKSLTK